MTTDLAKLLIPLAAAPLCAAAQGADSDSVRAERAGHPNIILFMVDDMGWQDTSLPFTDSITANNRKYRTPNMERLAAQGMKFTSAYASAVSSPSRFSLITGANAARHRVTNWTLHRGRTTDHPNSLATPPQWNFNGIARVPGTPNTYVGPSFVEALRAAGYHTMHVGKAHFGAIDTPGENPAHFGFETNVSGSAAGGLATYLSEDNFGHTPEGKPVSPFAVRDLRDYWGTGTFATEALTQEAIKGLDKAKAYNQPWFLYMSHYAVHVPIDRDPRFYQEYIDRGLGPKEAAYAALVEGMDKSLGDLLDWVEASGEADNTIVIFMADNGGYDFSDWRDGASHTQNAPLRSGKGSLLEGGIREPMIVSWPGRTAPGSKCDSYLLIEDFYPSILEMAGVENTDSVDGVSFVPFIDGSGDPSAGRALIWNFPNHWGPEGPGINFSCAIRKDNYKMIYNYVTGAKELYDLAADPYESTDVAASRPQVVRALSAELGRLLRERGGQRPTLTATGAPAPWPDEID